VDSSKAGSTGDLVEWWVAGDALLCSAAVLEAAWKQKGR
jgi:hypothetical protein